MTLAKAKKAIELSEIKAKELKVNVTTVIVDDHGDIVAMSRMDGAFYISPRFAQAKAHTSALLGLPSGDIAEYAYPEKPYYSINTSFGGELMVIAGGLPIKKGEKILGGIGVGGSLDVSQDVECAQAGLAVFK